MYKKMFLPKNIPSTALVFASRSEQLSESGTLSHYGVNQRIDGAGVRRVFPVSCELRTATSSCCVRARDSDKRQDTTRHDTNFNNTALLH